jgi:hypothetical protein
MEAYEKHKLEVINEEESKQKQEEKKELTQETKEERPPELETQKSIGTYAEPFTDGQGKEIEYPYLKPDWLEKKSSEKQI